MCAFTFTLSELLLRIEIMESKGTLVCTVGKQKKEEEKEKVLMAGNRKTYGREAKEGAEKTG